MLLLALLLAAAASFASEIDPPAEPAAPSDVAATASAAPSRTVGVKSTAKRGPLFRHLWCSACETMCAVHFDAFVQEKRQRVQLGSRLNDDNRYEYKPFWTSEVGATEAIERVCEDMHRSEHKHPFRLIKHGDKEWIGGAKETHPEGSVVSELGEIRHQLAEWCEFVAEADGFVRGFISAQTTLNNDFREALCVRELRACAPAAKTEL